MRLALLYLTLFSTLLGGCAAPVTPQVALATPTTRRTRAAP